MPETTKSYSNLEILQGAQYETTFTLSTGHSVSEKSYVATIRKDFTGTTDFGGRSAGAGTSGDPYRLEIFETNDTGIGLLTANSNSSADDTIVLKLYPIKTGAFDDDFEGHWDLMELDTSTNPDTHTRIVQGEVYINKGATRYETIANRSD